MKNERLPLTIGTCVGRGIAGLEVLLRSLVSAHGSGFSLWARHLIGDVIHPVHVVITPIK